MRRVKDENVIWKEEEILKMKEVDIEVEVEKEGGIIKKIIRSEEKMRIGDIQEKMKYMEESEREKRMKKEELKGGGFQI